MRPLFMTIILVSSVLLTSCNSLKVPKSVMDHEMSATPVDVVPTESEWKVPDPVKANENTPFSIIIKDRSHKPITSFETVHEKKMHLFIISRDLSYFSHIHPEYKEDGRFDFPADFPAGGDYKLIADFTPKGGGDSSVETHWLHVEGATADEEAIVPDEKLTKVVDGKEVSLTFDKLVPEKTLHMTFSIRDAKTKKPIKNLQPYLGAMGHTVAISADTEKYLHIHPMTTEGNGPKVTFMTIFPEKGIYKIWGQFKHDGKVFTVPFVVEVQ
ncbi:hypothetical protein [Neobacillus muris]|uniref:hypothetical protein n=1 Tax=Neobacillus muris TaxID=2941334 RepID=UPI00203D15F6|nr:hypothetical protein [Neobacillus muris]